MLFGQCMHVCAVLGGQRVGFADQNMKYGNLAVRGRGLGVATFWLEASRALHRDPFESMRERRLILESLIH